MNSKQIEIIETFGKGQSVVAGAGCGKTTTLVAKCLALLARNPKARFCAVSFTEKSVRDLREALTRGLGQELLGVATQLDSAHWVKTLHGLCYAVLKEFPTAAGLQGGERILLEDEVQRIWEQSVKTLWTSTDNEEISLVLERLLSVYNRDQLENLFKKLRSLMSFGVEEKITFEMADVWLVFQSIYHRYQHAKNRIGGLDFNDLELLALRALKDQSVSEYYQNHFDLVLVDEFQDTNPLQGSILERFVKPNFTNLCIVGDPKQSIYRFRDADVSVFQDLTARVPSQHLLDINYRSRPSIIEFVNQVCRKAFAESLLPYEPLISGRTEDAPEIERVSKLVIENEMDLAQFLKSEANAGVDLSEYVILARSVRKEKIIKYLKALEVAEVPYLLGSGGRFYSDPRVKELNSFLRGWISPENTLSQAVALRAPWIGINDVTLFKWSQNGGQSYFDQFFSENIHPLAQALKAQFESPLRANLYRPGQILEALLNVEGLDEELYLSIVSLWHKAEGLSSQGQRFEEVVQYFSSAIDHEKIEKEIPAPTERGMVRVLTVHSSKGLQFPRVILLDFDGEYRSPAAQQDLIWDRKKGVHLYVRDEEGSREKKNLENIKWAEVEKSAQIAESKRVFYVALTRAQEKLILVWKKEINRSKASEAPDFNPYRSDHWRGWVEASGEPKTLEFLRPESEPLKLEPERKLNLELNQLTKIQNFDSQSFRPRHSPSEWLILNQCAYRYHLKFTANGLSENEEIFETETEIEPELTDQEREAGPVSSSTSIAEKGSRIHRFLELEDWTGLRGEFAPEIQEEVICAAQIAMTVKPGIEVYKEFGFEVPLSNHEALVGMMDRLEINEAQKLIRVVDYKFTSKLKSPDELMKSYGLQLRLYVWAASKMVDFIPEQIEAELIHFTESSMFERVPLKINLKDLEDTGAEVKSLYDKARLKSGAPKLGDYCRYCEFVSRCPVFAKT